MRPCCGTGLDDEMKMRERLETLFRKYDFTDYRWIKPESIVVSQWVRLKCMFGCDEYGKNGSCPPNVPDVSECERFFKEYREAAVFHFEKVVDKPESRFEWTRKVNLKLLKLEREVFIAGYPRTFLLFMDSCYICSDCPGRRDECKNPKSSRPTPEAMAVDVFTTVRQYGYPIDVLSHYSQNMNRYAFLMIE